MVLLILEWIAMNNRFDTFENEKEIEELIKSLQAESIKYMKQPDAREFDCSEGKELLTK